MKINRLPTIGARYPAAARVIAITASSMFVSVIVANIFAAIMGMPTGWQHYMFALGVPAITTPIWAVPLVKANHLLGQMRAELERLAKTDSLSGLPNRRAFYEEARRLIKRASENGESVSAMMIDIDNFKLINDNYGHDFGDTVIRSVASTISAALKGAAGMHTALFARVGGDEFVLLQRGLDGLQVEAQAAMLCQAIRDMTFMHRGHGISTSVSIGAATRAIGEPLRSLLDAADLAVYEAKSRGRNCWRVNSRQGRRQPVAA